MLLAENGLAVEGDHLLDTKIIGSTLPVLEVTLQPGESIVSESGEMSWMTSAIDMTTTTQYGGGGGLMGALKRTVSGGSLFMTEYKAGRGSGMVAFATKLPGAILPIEVGAGRGYMVHRHGFVAGTDGIQFKPGFQRKLGTAFFGGEGFVMQHIEGEGQAWVELSGEVVSYDLAAGETLRVIPGHVGMFEDGVTFDIASIKGIKNVLFGADALFVATLTGPGKVWIQSLTVSGLASAIQPYLTTQTAEAGAAGGILGAAMKNFSS